MKAAVLWETGELLSIEDNIEIPDLKTGQVLVKMAFSGVCKSQFMEVSGARGKDKFLPHLLGHEGCGKVMSIGTGVSKVSKGDWVILGWIKGIGKNAEGAKYKLGKEIINSGAVTTFSTYTIVSENRLTVIPKDFDMRTAALFGCAVTTGFGVVNNDAKIKIGQSVLIFGVGGLGLNIAYAASLVSAFPIIGVDLHKNKIEMGKKFGLTHGIVVNSHNLKSEIYNIIGDKGPEITFETTGNARVMEQAYELTPNDGKTIFVGVPNDKISIYSLPLAFNKTLAASHGGNSVPDKDIPRYIRLIKNKKISLEKLITHEFDLSEINKAIALFRSGKAGRIILKISKEE